VAGYQSYDLDDHQAFKDSYQDPDLSRKTANYCSSPEMHCAHNSHTYHNHILRVAHRPSTSKSYVY
jgi:hypothetical protein